MDNCTARAAAVGLSQPLAESTGMAWVQHRRNLVQDPRKRSTDAEMLRPL